MGNVPWVSPPYWPWYIIYSSVPDFICSIIIFVQSMWLESSSKMQPLESGIHTNLLAAPQRQHRAGYRGSQHAHHDASCTPWALTTPVVRCGPKDLVCLEQAQVFCSFQGLVSNMKNQTKELQRNVWTLFTGNHWACPKLARIAFYVVIKYQSKPGWPSCNLEVLIVDRTNPTFSIISCMIGFIWLSESKATQ